VKLDEKLVNYLGVTTASSGKYLKGKDALDDFMAIQKYYPE
jgi:hypothetical protein